MPYRSSSKLIPCFLPFSGIFKSEFLIQALMSRQIVGENVIFIYQNLTLGVDKQRQIKFCKVKLLLLLNGSLNTLCFFYLSGIFC